MSKVLSASLLLGLAFVAGCGQKGGLYLPRQGKTASKPAGAQHNPAAHRNTGPGTAAQPGSGSNPY